ncbi:iron-containing alcohol dehydrogenase family protein [Microbacterium sp. A196]|uniref:iron-containing alcohol dehydrogenase family protein n=1 Tax=unclassified Microbacterium TaxID=2609290 RepID=UPI003FD1B565
MTQSRLYTTPTRVHAGWGSTAELAEHVRTLGGTRVALIGDAGLKRIGLLDRIAELLGDTVVMESLAEVDPTIQAAEAAASVARDAQADLVVGVGGGSALSQAKAVALLLTNASPVTAYVGIDVAPNRPAPFIAIPTTAGSGSEVSNAFVLYDTESDANVGMRGWGYEPDLAILDGEHLLGLPEVPMRDAAADALSHGFEALWANGATSFTDTVALQAVRTIRAVMAAAIRERRPEDLQALLEASTMANFACGNAGLSLVHAITGSSRIRVAHGRQNSVLLPIVAEFNRSVVSDDVIREIDALPELYRNAGIPTAFDADELIADAEDEFFLAGANSPFRFNNRRPSTDDELRDLARRAVATNVAVATA